MDAKTVATIMIVIVCVLLFPVFIGIIGGVFGIFASIVGGIAGLIGGFFGVVFGVIGAVVGSIFGFLGWIWGDDYDGFCDFNAFDGDVFAAVLIVLVIALVARSRKTPGPRR